MPSSGKGTTWTGFMHVTAGQVIQTHLPRESKTFIITDMDINPLNTAKNSDQTNKILIHISMIINLIPFILV